MKKRLLSFALAFVMVLGMLPAHAFAAEAELTWSGNTITLASGTTVGSATLTGLLIYKQGATSTFPEITGVTQDGTTLNVTLAEDTDPSYPLQAGFTAGSYYVQNINNTCTLKNGQGTMTVSVQVKPSPAPNAPVVGTGTFTINFSVPMGESYTVTAPTGEGFVFSGEKTVYAGRAYTFTVKAAEGYDGTSMVVKVNGDPVEGVNGTYTVENVSGDMVITVEGIVKKEVCTITAPVGEGFTFTGAETVYKGENYTFKIAVDNAYNASNMVVKAGETELTGENGTYTIEAVNEDTVITVSGIVEKTIYTVTLTEGTGYTLSGQSTSYAGEPYTFTVTVDDAVYKANEVVVKVNDEAVTLTDGKYTFAALDGDKTVTVENVVERQLFTVTKPEAEGITFTGADNVREGKPYTFSIKADQAYDVSGMVVKVNGEEITGTDGSYTLPSVSDDLTITVEGIAAKAIYHVTAPAAGKFTFTGGETVYGGDDYTFTVQANAGYTATVKVNGEDLTGSNGSYTVVAVSEDLVITVETERAPITGTEIPVTDGVIDITDRTIYSRSSYYAKATNIVVAGVSVKEAYEDGTTVSIVLPYTAADDAVVDITFGTSLNKCTMEGTTGSLTLADGEGTLNMTLTGMYISSLKSTATYTLIFIREEMPTDPPVCVKTADTAEVWKGHALEIDLRDYFTAAGTYYLVDGENKIPIEGSKYTYVPTVGGEQTLVFTAVNEFGESSERLTFTVTVKDIEGGLYIGHITSNGSLDHVVFTDAEGNLIEGLNVALEGTTIKVSVPRSYAADGQITATFALTQKDGLPKLSTSNAFNGSNDTKVYTTTLSNGAGSRSMYFYNSHPKATSNSYTTYKIEYITQNEAPVLAPGQSAAGETTITADQTYTLDLDGVFVDPDEGDSITGWTVSINGADAVQAEVDENNVYSWKTEVAGEYQLVFRAKDNYNAISGTAYTFRLTVENTAEMDSMTVSLPEDLEPVFYIATGFKDGIDQLGEEVSAQKGESADGVTAYTVSYPANVTMLSVRAEGWGGMAFNVQKDGTVSLRKMQFSVVDYDNNTAESTNTVTYGGNTAVAGTDGWLLVTGMEYVFAAVPKDASLAAVSGTATLEAGAETYIRNMMLGIKNPMTITVPAGSKAQLYKFNQYYSNTELDAKIIKDNGDGTTSYSFVADTKANGANYIYRVTMPGKITKAGWLAWGKQSLTVTYSDSDKSPDYRLDDYSGTGEASSGVAEDSVLLNINSRNHLNLSVGQSKVLKAYRAWEIIPVSYNNYIIPPDFTYTILSGNDVVSLSEKTSASAADGDWMTLTALKEGIAIIEVTYAAIKVEGGQYDGVYGASDPARAGLVVVQVGESDDPSVNFGIDSFASIGKAGSSNISYNPNNAKAWDAEFDTLYFTGDSGELKLTPTASGAITEVAVSHDKGANWTVLNGAEGTYTAKIVPGNNIIRVATASGTAYQVVRGDKIAVTLKELDGKSDSDGIVEAGETVRVTLVGLHSPIPKMAGNYNPGFGGNDDGYSSQHLNYTCNGEAIYGIGMQYNFVTAANYVDVVMPEDGSNVTLTDGYIGVGVIGLDNFVNGGDSHRNIPDNGCATRGSKTTWHTRSILPEITVEAGGESAANTAPIVRADAVTESEIFDDQKYAINPDTLFQDTDGNVLTFTLSVNGGEAEPVGVDFKFVPEQAGVYVLTFTASDGKETAQHTITLTVTARQQEEDKDDKFGLEDSEIAGYVTISVEDNAIRVEGETGLKFPVPLGTIIEPTRVPFKQDENIAQVTKRLLDHLGIGMKYSGTLESGFYLGAITNFEVDRTPYASMGEFDAGVGSGWMITQNDVFINKGASEFEVANGDILKWKYTCQLGADIGDDYATKRIENVEKRISEIGEVTLDKADEISAARAAYDELTEAQKQQVKNYTTLTAAETALAELKAAAAADQAAANTVEEKIAEIGTVTLESATKIAEARKAYNALTDAQKALVENYQTLAAAEDALTALKSAGLDEMYEAAAETLLTQTPVTGSTGGEWLVFGLSRALDKELTAAQKTAYEAAVQALLNSELNDSGQLNANKPTENARVALALTALGCDPANYNGKNLLSALEDTTWTTKQGNNSAAFALLAFNAAYYHASNEDTLIQSLLANQLSAGGWNINSGSADADTTAMVVQALAPYYQSNPNVKTAVDNALVYLKGLMNTKGQLNNGVDEPSVETVSQMIVALCELGIDPATWKTEHDVNLLHGLASFYVDGSKKGFAHTGDNTYNQMATEQAFYTMVAYKRFLNKDATSLYDMSDARVQKYTITVSDSVNGTVTPSKSIAAAGETITVSVAPNNGYKLKSLSMNGAALTADESGVYSFTMPEQVVTLTAVFEKLETVIEQDTTVSNGTASAVIPDTAIDEAVAAVGGTEDKVVTIIPTETGSADKVEVSIPADSAGKIADADAALIVQAPAGAVEIPKEILTQMEGTADQTVKITVEARTQEHIADAGITADTTGAVIVEVTIQKGDTKVTDFDSNQLTITIPVANGFVAGKTYDVIVISEGKANETVKGLCIQQGEQKVIQVKINHLSTFVVLNPVTAELVEAMDALAVADAKKVTYEKIMAIETAYDKLTIAEKLQIRDAYKAFQDQVEMFELYLEMIVEEAAEELEDFYKDLDQDDYSAKAWKKIKEVYNDALDALTEAHYEEEVYELLEEYLEYLEEAAAGELEVTFRLIGDWKHDDGVSGHDKYVTWIETTEYNMPAGSTIYDLFIKAIDDFDLNQKGASRNYVESIQAPDILGGYWIGEFDNGPNSGWMYTINGDHPGYGLKEQDLEDGDEVIWHYVDDYTLEERKTTSKYYERWLEADDISPEAWVKRHLDKIVTIKGKGEVKPELKMSHIGKDVKFTFTPAEGWVIKNVYVDGKDKGAIETYTYKKLAMDARIEVVFVQNVAFQMNFADVSESQWFYDDVYFAVSNGLFNGIDEVTFAPGASMTRAMLVTVLYRLEGQPAVYGGSAFADVAAGQWYTDAVIWATRNGIVNGLGDGKFGTNDNVTREQMAAILYRYAQNCGYDTTARANLNGYTDAAKISAYAQEAMSWANAMSLINGRTATSLAPTGTATRAEVAAIFHRFVENIAK